MNEPGQGEPGQSEAAHPPSGGAAGALRRLERAVCGLEAAADVIARRSAEDGELSSGMHAEAEALRSLQHLLADRLDAAIARLKSGIGG